MIDRDTAADAIEAIRETLDTVNLLDSDRSTIRDELDRLDRAVKDLNELIATIARPTDAGALHKAGLHRLALDLRGRE
jgi:hypothetical protein